MHSLLFIAGMLAGVTPNANAKFIESQVYIPLRGGMAYRTSVALVFVGEDYAGEKAFTTTAEYFGQKLGDWEFPRENIRIVRATSKGRMDAVIKEAVKFTTNKDRVIVAYIGHGESTKTKRPVLKLSLNGSGMLASQLVDSFKTIKARHRMLLIDACRSGNLSGSFRGIAGMQIGPEAFTRKSSFAFLSSAPGKDAVVGSSLTKFMEAFLEAVDKSGKPFEVRSRGVYVSDIVSQLQQQVPDSFFGSVSPDQTQMLLSPFVREVAEQDRNNVPFDATQEKSVEAAIANLRGTLRQGDLSLQARAHLNLQLAVALKHRHDPNLRLTSLREAVQILSDLPDLERRYDVQRRWVYGDALLILAGLKDDPLKNFREATEVWQGVLRDLSDKHVWASAQCYLGMAHGLLSELDDKVGNLRKSILAFKASAEILKLAVGKVPTNRASENWWCIQHNMGNSYLALSDVDDAPDNLRRAIMAFGEALRAVTEKDSLVTWARSQDRLGIAHLKLSEHGDKASNLHKAIVAFESAMRAGSEKDLDPEWGQTKMNWGLAHANLSEIEQDKAGYLLKAITAYESLLGAFTKQKLGETWLDLEQNLGVARWRISSLKGQDKAGNLNKAITAFESALTELAEDKHPERWGQAQVAQASAYFELAMDSDKATNLRKAIEGFTNADRALKGPNPRLAFQARFNLLIAQNQLKAIGGV